jgi:hypothetical protein
MGSSLRLHIHLCRVGNITHRLWGSFVIPAKIIPEIAAKIKAQPATEPKGIPRLIDGSWLVSSRPTPHEPAGTVEIYSSVHPERCRQPAETYASAPGHMTVDQIGKATLHKLTTSVLHSGGSLLFSR